MASTIYQILSLCCIASALFQLTQGTISHRSIDPEVQKSIDWFVQNVYLPVTGVSGMGLTVVQNDGEVLYTTGYGLADEQKGIPNGNGTQFLIGSITKSFTSTLAVKVLSEKFPELGEDVLDTPIRKLSPAFNFVLGDRFRSEYVTFRDLLGHRVCLVRDDYSLTVEPFNSSSEVYYRQRYARNMCGIRSEFQYSNQMYVTAGEILSTIAKRPYEDLVQDLLTELGMLNTTFVKKTDDFSNMPYRAMPYYVRQNVSYPTNPELMKRLPAISAAGGLYTTPNDMARYMRFHLSFGKLDDEQIIPEDAMRWMTKPTTHFLGLGFKNADEDLIVSNYAYGLGLWLASYDSWQYTQHSGYFSPYYSLMSFFPRQDIAIFTSHNQGPILADPTVLHVFIYETLKGTENATEKALQVWKQYDAISKQKESKKKATLAKIIHEHKYMGNIKRQNNEIVGQYGSGSAGELEIVERFNDETNTNELYLAYGKWAHGWLEYFSGTLYKIKWTTDIVHDNYAAGVSDVNYCSISNGTITFVTLDGMWASESLQLGVSLDNLPPIPWDADSCGPEDK